MSDARERRWLPPQAPGGADPPRYGPPERPPAPTPAPAPAPAPTYAPPSGAAPQYASPPVGRAGSHPPPFLAPGPPGNGAAIASLITGIAGLVLFIFSGFGLFFVLNLPPSIMAWVLGVQGRRKVDRGQTGQHRGLAQAGLVLGVVGTLLGILAVIGWVIAITTSEEVRDELRKQFDDASRRSQFLHGALYATGAVLRLCA